MSANHILGKIEVPSNRPSHVAEAIADLKFLLPHADVVVERELGSTLGYSISTVVVAYER